MGRGGVSRERGYETFCEGSGVQGGGFAEGMFILHSLDCGG